MADGRQVTRIVVCSTQPLPHAHTQFVHLLQVCVVDNVHLDGHHSSTQQLFNINIRHIQHVPRSPSSLRYPKKHMKQPT